MADTTEVPRLSLEDTARLLAEVVRRPGPVGVDRDELKKAHDHSLDMVADAGSDSAWWSGRITVGWDQSTQELTFRPAEGRS